MDFDISKIDPKLVAAFWKLPGAKKNAIITAFQKEDFETAKRLLLETKILTEAELDAQIKRFQKP